jgi:exopolysaccharide biosynthesis protein
MKLRGLLGLFIAVFLPSIRALEVKYQPIVPGLAYAHLSLASGPWSIHVARLDLSRKDFKIVTTHARDVITALSPVSEQLKLLPAKGWQPLAAVNGDFFVLQSGPFRGDPAGLQILDGEVISLPRQASFWVDQHGCHIDTVESLCRVIWPDGSASSLRLNERPEKNSIVLFTTRFGETTRVTNGVFMTLTMPRHFPFPPLRPEMEYRVQVHELYTNLNPQIDNGTAVLVVTGAETNNLTFVKKGSIMEIDTYFAPNLRGVKAAIGGGPVLLHENQTGNQKRAAYAHSADPSRNPRTAVGFNRRFLFLVEVDGRQPGLSVGMTFEELAALMKDFGCKEAMNLDGGGSSTFWLDGKLRNSPSDKRERGVANALIIARPSEIRH